MPLHPVFQPPPEVRTAKSTTHRRKSCLLRPLEARPLGARRQGIKEAKRAAADDLDESLSMLAPSPVSQRYGWQSRQAYLEKVHSMPKAATGSAHPVDGVDA